MFKNNIINTCTYTYTICFLCKTVLYWILPAYNVVLWTSFYALLFLAKCIRIGIDGRPVSACKQNVLPDGKKRLVLLLYIRRHRTTTKLYDPISLANVSKAHWPHCRRNCVCGVFIHQILFWTWERKIAYISWWLLWNSKNECFVTYI